MDGARESPLACLAEYSELGAVNTLLCSSDCEMLEPETLHISTPVIN